MSKAYSVPALGSLLVAPTTSGMTYRSLRRQQNQAWAQSSVNKGMEFVSKGHIKQALQCYQHALEVEPLFCRAYIAQGAAYVHQGKLSMAVQKFEEALRSLLLCIPPIACLLYLRTILLHSIIHALPSVDVRLDPKSPHAARYLAQAREKVLCTWFRVNISHMNQSIVFLSLLFIQWLGLILS